MTSSASVAATELEKRGAPPEVASALEKLAEELRLLAGENFAGLILYGGLARGRFRPGRSDVNLVLLLRDASVKSLEAVAQALRDAWRDVRVDAMILTPEEIPEAADAFPSKFLHIQEFHVCLAGEDPFTQLEVNKEHLRLRVEQELRNIAMRLRRRYVSIFDDENALSALMAEILGPLAVLLRSLLKLSGKAVPEDHSSAAVLEAAAIAFNLDRQALAQAARLRREGQIEESVPDVFGRFLASVTAAAEIADSLEAGK